MSNFIKKSWTVSIINELDRVSKDKGVKMPCPVPDRVKRAAYFVDITEPYIFCCAHDLKFAPSVASATASNVI